MKKIAFIGMGVMGAPMAGHLAKAGHQVMVYNRSRGKAEAWLERYKDTGEHHAIADTPMDAARDAEIVITCVGNDDDLSDVVLGRKGVFASQREGTLFIDHTTVSAKIARQISVEGKSGGILCVDAPVSGGQSGAENGTLSIMCGGTPKAFEAAKPILAPYASRMVHVGKPGAGQNTKMCNQICIAGILGGLTEALRFAQASRLDLDTVYEAISGGAAQSWQMDNRWRTMADDSFDFGFAIDWMRKDLGLALDEARTVGATLPVTAIIDQFYADVQAMGHGRQDTSALVRRIRNR